MNEEKRSAYQARLTSLIEELEATLKDLVTRAKRAEADLRERFEAEEADLRKRLDEARVRFSEVREASEEGWEEVRAGAGKMWTDVLDAWERTGRRSGSPGGSEDAEPTSRRDGRGGVGHDPMAPGPPRGR